MAPALEALDEKMTELGGQPLDPGPMDAAIAGIKQRAAAAVATAQLTPEERNAKAVAKELAPLLAQPTTQDTTEEVESEQQDEQDEADDGLYGWLDEAEGVYYQTDAAGNFLTNPDGSYKRFAPGTVGFDDDEAAAEEADEDWSDVEEEWDDADEAA
jgi:hypothetical protein